MKIVLCSFFIFLFALNSNALSLSALPSDWIESLQTSIEIQKHNLGIAHNSLKSVSESIEQNDQINTLAYLDLAIAKAKKNENGPGYLVFKAIGYDLSSMRSKIARDGLLAHKQDAQDKVKFYKALSAKLSGGLK